MTVTLKVWYVPCPQAEGELKMIEAVCPAARGAEDVKAGDHVG